MKTTIKTILASLLLTMTFAAHGVVYTGGPFINPANGHSYYQLSAGSWTDAEAYAQTIGGHLATINDAAENAWVFANVVGTTPGGPWIGLNDSDGNGIWTWASGEPVTYLNWAPGEPNVITPADFYVNYFPSTTAFPGKWNNAPNSDSFLTAVAEVVPEPSAMSLMFLAFAGSLLKRVRRS